MYAFPITEENFPQAWTYGQKKYCQSRRLWVTGTMAVPISQLLFFLSFSLLTWGIVYDGFPGLPREFLQQVPVLSEIWEQGSNAVFSWFPQLWQQLLCMAGLLYGLPFLLAFLLWLLTLLLYHPAKPVLSMEPSRHAQDLLNVSRQISHYTVRQSNSTLGLCSTIYALLLAGGCLCFLHAYKTQPPVSALLQEGTGGLYFVLAFLMLIGLYFLLNFPLRLLLSPFCSCSVAGRFHLDAEAYYTAVLRRSGKSPSDSE